MTFFGFQKISKYISIIILCISIITSCADEKINVLILSGSNNHNWQETTPLIKSTLEESNKFSVEITNDPANINPDRLEYFDVIVSNWNTWPEITGKRWNAALEDRFVDFIAGGKGFVVVHAGSASLQDWEFFQKISGGTWELEKTGHGPVHIFKVDIDNSEHPITKGLQSFYIKDELWHKTKLQEKIEILASAYSAKDSGGTGENEPVYLTTRHDKSRGFFSILGHNKFTMENNAWKTLLLRGTEWAATGKVSINPLTPWPASEIIAKNQSE